MLRKATLTFLLAGAMAVGLACGGGGGRTKEATPAPAASQQAAATGGAAATQAVAVPGVTDTEIKIGAHTSLTGPIAVYNVIPKTSSGYFNMINEQGGINGRKITFLLEDDAYSPPKSVEVTKKLVEQDKIFAMFQGLGTPTHTAVLDYLKQNNVPDFFVATGASKWTVPVQPTVFGFQINYISEGKVLGKWIVDNYPNKKVGFLFQNDDFGKDGVKGAKEVLQGKLQFGPEESYEVTATNLNAQVLNLKNAGVDVVYSFGTPALTAAALKFAKQQGWNAQWVISAVNFDASTIKLAGADVIEGVVSGGSFKLPEDVDDPEVKKHIEFLKKYAPGVEAGTFTIFGQSMAELWVEVLKKAGRNLTRESVIKAAESIKGFKCSLCLGTINMSDKDHAPIEGMRLGQVKNGRWVYISDYVDFETTK
jgi:branched-chain amino acid transport system substrate-binding protein